MQHSTETDIVLGHTAKWFQNSEMSMERFAHDLLAPALEAAGLIEEAQKPQDAEAFTKGRKAWRQRVDRLFNGSQPFPLEWKWAWINCVAEPFRTEIKNDLQIMAGMLPVARPDLRAVNGVESTRARIAQVMIEVAEFFQAAAEPAEDGRYCRDDRGAAAEMIEKGFEAAGAILTELTALAAGTGVTLPVGPFAAVVEVRHG
ncbi:hypothetical protein [uncultured Pseudomonas sp.]|uniref:hypothetical protein n=1 Tax=uncultured Pseudomonas sp. TaxID=114707 RepID=UPI002606EAAD|nr:hypothetical protein [uncultured Pseudomonas sp.]